MDYNPAVAFIKDEAGRMVYVNRTFERLFQTTQQAIEGKNDFELWPPEVARTLREHDLGVLASNQPTETLEDVPTPDGVLRHWLVFKFPITNNAGQRFLGGTAIDLTARLKAEQALAGAEKKYRAIFESAGEGIFQSTPEGRYLTVNPAFARILGYDSPEELIQQCTDIARQVYVQPRDREELKRRLDEHGVVTGLEHESYRKDRSTVWVSLNARAIRDADGKVILYEGSIEDITERKRMEESLKDSEALYHSLVENLPLNMFRKDLAGRFTFANAQFCATTGKTLPELLGKTDFDIASPELAKKFQADDQRVIATGTVFETVEDNQRVNGQRRLVRVLKSPLHNAAGQIIGIQGIFWDITEQRELEEQLRQSQKMEAIGQLASGVAHDFNNLLTVIQGYTELVMTDERVPAEMVKLLTEVHTAGERAASLTHQLLTFSRKQIRRPEALDLNAVIANVAKLLQQVIGAHITVQLETYSGLPPVQADASMMDQILLNLAVNARDAMPRGGRLTIRTAVVEVVAASVQQNPEARAGRFVCLTVSDTGCGMTPEIQSRIFEPFFTTKETGKGTGLGLATVFGIVKQHEGWIEVDSAVGVGTTFNVFLPASLESAKTSAAQAAAPKVRGGKETILLVEDEEALREMAALILQKHGYHVLEAASGVKALAVWQERAAEIDLLLTDMVMPEGMSGRALAEKLLAEKPGLKVIYASGYSPNFDDLNFGLKEGVNFLQKPYHPRHLAQTVRDCLDR